MHSCFYLILLLFRTFFLYLFRGGEVYSNVAPSLPYALKTKNERNFSLRMDISKTVPGFKPINIIRTCTRAQVYIRVDRLWGVEVRNRMNINSGVTFWVKLLRMQTRNVAKNYCFGGYYVLIFPSVKMNFSFSAVKFPIFEKQNISLWFFVT